MLELQRTWESVRSIMRVDVSRVSDSCGYGVPLMGFKGDRRALDGWAKNKTQDDLDDYHALKNAVRVDGLPGVPPVPRHAAAD